MKREGAQAKNINAVGHGLHSLTPVRRVEVLPDVGFGGLAVFTNTLVDAALSIARELETRLHVADDDAGLITLYAAVAGELTQLAGELQGETGIKPASLGTLTDSQYDAMMKKQAEALSLILSQCVSAWQYVQMHEELKGQSGLLVRGKFGELVANPVLARLAGHMRTAKRLIKDMAADIAWRERGSDDDRDLASAVMDVIKQARKEARIE